MRIFLLLIFMLFFSVNSHSASIAELLRVGSSMDEIDHALKQETKNFKKIQEAVTENKISPGMLQEDIFDEYGQPSVNVPMDNGGNKAVYKPADKSYFDKDKVTLFFDPQNKLLRIKQG